MYKSEVVSVTTRTYDNIIKAHNDIKNAQAIELYKKYMIEKEEKK